MTVTLSVEQQRVLDLINDGQNVFCTGYAGTGKSFLLAEVVRQRSLGTTYGNTVVTASSGLAALNVNGQTIHRFAGVGTADGPTDYVVDSAAHNVRTIARWRDCGLLIIDIIGWIIHIIGSVIFIVLNMHVSYATTACGYCNREMYIYQIVVNNIRKPIWN